MAVVAFQLAGSVIGSKIAAALALGPVGTAVATAIGSIIGAGIGNEAVAPGAFTVILERSDAVASSAASFVVESGTPTPGICAIRPASGPVGTPIEVVGENFSNASLVGTVWSN